jgi:hypothetical protein
MGFLFFYQLDNGVAATLIINAAGVVLVSV